MQDLALTLAVIASRRVVARTVLMVAICIEVKTTKVVVREVPSPERLPRYCVWRKLNLQYQQTMILSDNELLADHRNERRGIWDGWKVILLKSSLPILAKQACMVAYA